MLRLIRGLIYVSAAFVSGIIIMDRIEHPVAPLKRRLLKQEPTSDVSEDIGDDMSNELLDELSAQV